MSHLRVGSGASALGTTLLREDVDRGPRTSPAGVRSERQRLGQYMAPLKINEKTDDVRNKAKNTTYMYDSGVHW